MTDSEYPSYRQGCVAVSQQHLLLAGGVGHGRGGGCPLPQIVNIHTNTHNSHLVDGVVDGGVVEDGVMEMEERGCRSDSVLVNTGSAVLMVGGRRLVR